jgi:hypothetical protein
MEEYHTNVTVGDIGNGRWGAWASKCRNEKACTCEPRKTGEIFFSASSQEDGSLTFDELKEYIRKNGGTILGCKVEDIGGKFKLKWSLPPSPIVSKVATYECIHNKQNKPSTFKIIYNGSKSQKALQPIKASPIKTSLIQAPQQPSQPIQAQKHSQQQPQQKQPQQKQPQQKQPQQKQPLSYAQVTIMPRHLTMEKQMEEQPKSEKPTKEETKSEKTMESEKPTKTWSMGSGSMQDPIWTCCEPLFCEPLFYEPPGFEFFSSQSLRTTSRLEMWMNE